MTTWGHQTAYPIPDSDADGLTKRELFAAMAMQALIANPDVAMDYCERINMAVRTADALIEALNK